MAPRRPRRSAHAAHTGSARGTPSPRRNHGFAPRLQSGADAEAILSEAPVPAAEHKVGCTGLLSRAGPRAPRALGRDRYQPRLPDASPGLVATPVPPRPPRIRLRSDTRSACPTPGHVPAPPASHSLSTKQRGLGMSQGPPGPDQARQTAGPRAEAAVTKRLLCRPSRPAARAKAPPPAAQARPHRPRCPRLGRDEEAGAFRGQPLPRSPRPPPPRRQPPPAGYRAVARSPPA